MLTTEKAGNSLPLNWPDISCLIYSTNCIELAAWHIDDQPLSHIEDPVERERLKRSIEEIRDSLLECYDSAKEVLYRILTPGLRPCEVNPENE